MKRQLLLLFSWLLLATPVAVRAQFNYTVTNGRVSITGYLGTNSVVVIPDTINGLPVTAIAELAFVADTSLTSVTIPNTVVSIGDNAFAETGLSSVSIPNSVTSIGDSAFFYCSSLASVSIPNSVTVIGVNAFGSCTSLTNVTIPSSITVIGDLAFGGCTSLTAINVQTNNPTYRSVGGVLFDKNQTTLIEYPAGNIAISYAIPNSVTNIGNFAFLGCGSLNSVTIPNSVTVIPVGAFQKCTSLTSVSIPNSVVSIGGSAFVGDTSLTGVTIPSSVTVIGDSAFGACTNLTAINVETNNPAYRSVGGVLFNKNQTTLIEYPAGKVGSYSIPNSVTGVGSNSFSGCTGLTSVTMGNNVINLGDAAFFDCNKLVQPHHRPRRHQHWRRCVRLLWQPDRRHHP